MATVYVDLDRVVSLAGVSDRVEAAYRQQLQGPIQRTAASVIRTLRPRASAGAAGVRAEIAPQIDEDARRMLGRMLDLPVDIFRKNGTRTLVAFDEFQDVLRIGGEVEGLIRSHIQHQSNEAAYVFAGSHPGFMLALFTDRERPLFGQARPIALTPASETTRSRSTYTVAMPRLSASASSFRRSVVLPKRRGADRRAVWPASARPSKSSSSRSRSMISSGGSGRS